MKKTIWYSVLMLSLITMVVLTYGFSNAIYITFSAKPSPTIAENNTSSPGQENISKAKDQNTLRILVLGDSLAKGTGDQQRKGFAGHVSNALASSSEKKVELINLGVDGQTSSELVLQIQRDSVKELIATADIVLLSIGGNDIRRAAMTRGELDFSQVAAVQNSYLDNVGNIIASIRQSNPQGYISFLGLYNPYDTSELQESIDLLHSWNFSSQQLVEADPRAVFVPSYDVFKWNLEKYLSFDGLHPNDIGYEVIGRRITEALQSKVK